MSPTLKLPFHTSISVPRAIPLIAAVTGLILATALFFYLASIEEATVQAEFERRSSDRAQAFERELEQLLTLCQVEAQGALASYPEDHSESQQQLRRLEGQPSIKHATVIPTSVLLSSPLGVTAFKHALHANDGTALRVTKPHEQEINLFLLAGGQHPKTFLTGFTLDDQAAWAIAVPMSKVNASGLNGSGNQMLVISGTFQGLVNNAFRTLQAGGIHVVLETLGNGDRWLQEYTHVSRTEGQETPAYDEILDSDRRLRTTLDFADKRVRVHCYSSKTLAADLTTNAPMITLAIGHLLTGLLFLYLRNALDREASIRDEVQRQTEEITRSKSALETEIEHRKEIAQSLEDAKELAEEALKTKSQFLANMSHELRTPLNGIVGAASLLEEAGNLSHDQREFLTIIERSSNTLLSHIESILDLSKADANRLTLKEEPFALHQALGELIVVVSPSAAEKEINLLLSIEPDVPNQVTGDAFRIRQILTNLLANAVKFTEEGEVELRVSRVRAGISEVELDLSVRDTGIGINEDQQEAIFEAFNQADNSATRKHGGTGLGLTIAYRLATLMRGSLSVDSVPNSGSTFTFKVRLQCQAPKASAFEIPALFRDRQRSVIIVDSNQTTGQHLERSLKSFGITSLLTSNIDDAISDIENLEHAYSLVIVDLDSRTTSSHTNALTRINRAASERKIPLLGLLPTNPKFTPESISVVARRVRKPVKIKSLFTTIQDTLLSLPESANDKVGDLNNHQEGGSKNTPSFSLDHRILVVEDDPTSSQLLCKMLVRLDYQADNATTGLTGWNLAKTGVYDVIFLDLNLPHIHGADIARRIREQLPTETQPYIIAVTANAQAIDRAHLLEAGADEYLTKPLTFFQLKDALMKVRNRRNFTA